MASVNLAAALAACSVFEYDVAYTDVGFVGAGAFGVPLFWLERRLAGFLHEAFNTRAGGATAAISSPSPKKSRPVRGRASGSKTESCVGAAPGRVRGSP